MSKLSEFCTVCNERWQFIHEHGDDWFLAHYCDVAKAYVFWNRRYTFYLSTGDVFKNPPNRGDGE